VLAAGATAATFAPWGGSGSRSRSSYEILDVADRAGVVPESAGGVVVAWFLVPLLCGAVLVAVAAGKARLAAALGATLGAFVTTGGVLVARSPLTTEAGAVLGIVIGGCTVLMAIAVASDGRRGRRDDERPVGSDQQR
jgi:hypothetical protein